MNIKSYIRYLLSFILYLVFLFLFHLHLFPFFLSMGFYISFSKKQSARTGNLFFQYLFTKTLCIASRHLYRYIPIEEWRQYVLMNEIPSNEIFHVTEENARSVIETLVGWHHSDNSGNPDNSEKKEKIQSFFSYKHILCDGFFQQSDYLVPFRDELLDCVYDASNMDYWIQDDNHTHFSVRDFLTHPSPIIFKKNEILLNLRLDDFIQLPCATSDILPPSFYLSILTDTIGISQIRKIWIVCDQIHQDWEKRYLEFFQQFSKETGVPVELLQNSLVDDCATMREAPILIHSNSTLCWIMSFLSRTPKQRYIPMTNFYSGQSLQMIELTDGLYKVRPLTHSEVYQLRCSPPKAAEEHTIYSLPYSIPEEYVIPSVDEVLSKKQREFATVNPFDRTTYIYGPGQQADYYRMYQESRFAYTCKKGGWDCLRHYEIMANGCIPYFVGLEHCPENTLCTFPKELLMQAYTELLPWDEKSDEKKMKYAFYLSKMMENLREYGTCHQIGQYVLNTMGIYRSPGNPIRNVLLITGNEGVNYTRELTWIGIQRYIQLVGGVAVEYPRIDYLYGSPSTEKDKGLYGFGYTYSRTLTEEDSPLLASLRTDEISVEERICQFSNSDAPVHRFTEETLDME